MRFFDLEGTAGKGRRQSSSAPNVSPDEIGNPTKLSLVLGDVIKRLGDLESKTEPAAVEFEVDCPADGTVEINHGFDGPIRWYVTSWKTTRPGPLAVT